MCEELVPAGDAALTRRLLGWCCGRAGPTTRSASATTSPGPGSCPLPGQGPTLVGPRRRPTPPAPRTWRLGLGDIELF